MNSYTGCCQIGCLLLYEYIIMEYKWNTIAFVFEASKADECWHVEARVRSMVRKLRHVHVCSLILPRGCCRSLDIVHLIFCMYNMQSLYNVRTFHSLNYRSAAKAEGKVLIVLILCCIVECPTLQLFVTVFHSIVKFIYTLHCNWAPGIFTLIYMLGLTTTGINFCMDCVLAWKK